MKNDNDIEQISPAQPVPPSVQNQDKVIQKPIHNPKNRLPIILAIILIFIVSIGAYYFLVNKSQSKYPVVSVSPTVSPQVTLQQKTIDIQPTETANWLTFSAKDFVLKYPAEAELISGKSGFYIRPANLPQVAANPLWYQINLDVVKNIPQSTTEEYLQSQTDYNKSTLKHYKNGEINGYSFDVKQGTHPSYNVIEVKNNILYSFSVEGRYTTELSDYSRSMLDKLISTVRLTNDLSPDPKITDLIRFTLPTGWTQKVTNVTTPGFVGTIQILSPDLAPGAAGGPPTNAVGISFEATLDGKTETLEKKYQAIYNEIHDPNPGGAVSHDLTKTTVASYPTISFYYDFEGHSHTYYVWNGDYLWKIEIGAPSATQENEHKNDIDSVLSSIQFTNK